VGTLREMGKGLSPAWFVAAYRRGRRRIIGRFGAPITPLTLPRILARTTAGRASARFLGRTFPEAEASMRRRVAIRRYLAALSYEFGPPLPDDRPDGTVARPHTFRDIVVQETLGRTDLIFQGFDRRIEGISARTTERVLEIRRRLAALREELAQLVEASEASTSPAD
jgi:hypothetical protein